MGRITTLKALDKHIELLISETCLMHVSFISSCRGEQNVLLFFFQIPNKDWLLFWKRYKNTILALNAAYYKHLQGAPVNDLKDPIYELSAPAQAHGSQPSLKHEVVPHFFTSPKTEGR